MRSKKKNPPKWTNIYPQGTKEGDEEQKFFIALARHKKYIYRSVSALAKESGLTEKRVEEIIKKYYNMGVVVSNPKNSDQWGYWERAEYDIEEDKPSLSDSDKEDRIKKASP